MTFGEHLDELRLTLIKASLALVIGFGVALMFAGTVVDYVQTPLKDALSDYYRGLAQQQYLAYLEQRRQAGDPVPQDLEAAAALMASEGLVPEERLIDPREALESVQRAFPNAVDAGRLPPRDPTAPIRRSELVPLRMFHNL